MLMIRLIGDLTFTTEHVFALDVTKLFENMQYYMNPKANDPKMKIPICRIMRRQEPPVCSSLRTIVWHVGMIRPETSIMTDGLS